MKYKWKKRFIFKPMHWFEIKVGWEHPTDPHLTEGFGKAIFRSKEPGYVKVIKWEIDWEILGCCASDQKGLVSERTTPPGLAAGSFCCSGCCTGLALVRGSYPVQVHVDLNAAVVWLQILEVWGRPGRARGQWHCIPGLLWGTLLWGAERASDSASAGSLPPAGWVLSVRLRCPPCSPPCPKGPSAGLCLSVLVWSCCVAGGQEGVWMESCWSGNSLELQLVPTSCLPLQGGFFHALRAVCHHIPKAVSILSMYVCFHCVPSALQQAQLTFP